MAGRVTVLTPVDSTPAIELGPSTWRKQILPVGWLDYPDGATSRRINFTPEYLRELVTSFKEKAFDGVPLQLGATHNNDPENTGGQVIGLDCDGKGLYATVSATDRGAQLLKDNPNLGVSVRFVEDYERQDGTSKRPFKAALQHVLATWTPRVAGMAPWQAVACADESDGRFADLSALVFTADGSAVAPDPATGGQVIPPQEARPTVAPQVTEEELAAVRSVISILPTLQKLITPPEGETSTETTVVAPTAQVVAPTATVTPIVKPAEAVGEADEDPEAEAAIAAATGDGEGKVVDLALVELRTDRDRQAIELAEMRAERDEEKWRYESEQLVRDYGIPPAIVALAEPLLKGSKHVVELAQGGTADAGAVLRNVLHTVAKTYGKRVDLSGPLGSAHEDDATADEAKAKRQAIHASANAARLGK